MENFLAVKKNYLGLKLKSVDLLVISQIEEFERNGCKCYLTNEQFSEMFGESVSTIKRTLDKLEDLNIIRRDTTYIKGNGRANKQRVLTVNGRKKWKVYYVPIGVMESSNLEMESSDDNNGKFSKEVWMDHNEPIKDKEKIKNRKEKDNDIEINHNMSTIFEEEEDYLPPDDFDFNYIYA